MVCNVLKVEEVKEVADVEKMLSSHEWVHVHSELYDFGGIISTMRCMRCGAEWSSAFLPGR